MDGSFASAVGGAVDGAWRFIVVSFLFAWPLAIWKTIDIIVWICGHFTVSMK